MLGPIDSYEKVRRECFISAAAMRGPVSTQTFYSTGTCKIENHPPSNITWELVKMKITQLQT